MAHGRVMGSFLDLIRRLGSLAGNLAHHFDEAIERLAALGFGRFDHQRLVEEQREVDCRGVEADAWRR